MPSKEEIIISILAVISSESILNKTILIILLTITRQSMTTIHNIDSCGSGRFNSFFSEYRYYRYLQLISSTKGDPVRYDRFKQNLKDNNFISFMLEILSNNVNGNI